MELRSIANMIEVLICEQYLVKGIATANTTNKRAG